jgi:hypothetical protein
MFPLGQVDRWRALLQTRQRLFPNQPALTPAMRREALKDIENFPPEWMFLFSSSLQRSRPEIGVVKPGFGKKMRGLGVSTNIFCMFCQRKTPSLNARIVKTSTGQQHQMKSTCTSCGKNKCSFVSNPYK